MCTLDYNDGKCVICGWLDIFSPEISILQWKNRLEDESWWFMRKITKCMQIIKKYL